ncbi:predicted protein [Methanosarcina acetivorans C2A]|uniref:Uncharacterized protein n=1 Tax=Methanosarcina acetivorans (strain ATCC 35395 / DSM 2834 / JCM 12185 / C2A) TaxID=188937 RepID=Q8TP96_METAC|nr:predicted protein [Methanosarcina acetivorans C2A]
MCFSFLFSRGKLLFCVSLFYHCFDGIPERISRFYLQISPLERSENGKKDLRIINLTVTVTVYLIRQSYEFITYQFVNFIQGAKFRGDRELFQRVYLLPAFLYSYQELSGYLKS